jgi:hypothetical protein
MAHEQAPGVAAPVAGNYEQLRVVGQPAGIRANLGHGHPLPPAPRGHTWTLVEAATETRLEWLITPAAAPALDRQWGVSGHSIWKGGHE